jgi:sugar (pentulose or hexulose) kinase
VAAGNALQLSPVWSQIIADVLGRPVQLSRTREASTLGAALLALEGAGKIQSIDQVHHEVEKTFEPDLKRHQRYQQGLERQQKIYQALIASAE